MSEANGGSGSEAARTKSRSPSYPAYGLETCVGWAKKMYDAEKKSATSAVVVARHTGYNTLSGASRQAIAAMKKFGLLVEEPGDRLRLSDEAVRVILQPDEGERLKTLRALAIKPIIIHEMLRDHPDGLPSDETLKFKLVDGRKFSDDGAATFLKALSETIRFAKLEPGSYLPSMTPPAPAVDVSHDSPGNTLGSPSHGFAPPRKRAVGDAAPISVELSDGTCVTVQATAPLTSDTFSELLDYLDVYKKILQKRAGKTDPTPTASE